MPQSNFVKQYGPKIGVALLLTLASGIVDIVGYLGIFHLFTAHITGTTVQFGRGLVERQRADVLFSAIIIGAFFGGSIMGRAGIEIAARTRVRKIASITLATEGFMLAAFAGVSISYRISSYWGLAILASCMGIQTATLTSIGPLTVHTTFVTGMVNKLAQLVSHIVFRAYDMRHCESVDSEVQQAQREEIRMTVFLIGVWVFYVGGAVIGTWSFGRWGIEALFVAASLLAVSFVADQFRPLSTQEEREQSER